MIRRIGPPEVPPDPYWWEGCENCPEDWADDDPNEGYCDACIAYMKKVEAEDVEAWSSFAEQWLQDNPTPKES